MIIFALMKANRVLILSFILLTVVAALYRVIPDRPLGFAPQWAMALFAGSIIKDKKWAIAFPILSMLLSDIIYQYFYAQGLSDMPGFYKGQATNYVLFAAMTVIGFYMKKISVSNVVLFSLIICLSFFVLSNFFVWASGAGYSRPQTFNGLMLTYADGLPFLKYNIISTLLFGGLLFGVYHLILSRFKAFVDK